MSFIVNPSITPPFTAGGVAYGTGSGAKINAAGTTAQVLQSNGTLAPSWVTLSASSGTVSSVAATVPSIFSISGSPITTSGTLAMTYSGTALPVANGGTSLTTLTAKNVILGNGSSAPTFVAPSTSGNFLTSNGTTWTSAAPPTATALVLLDTQTVNAVSAINIDFISTTYTNYLLIYEGIYNSSANSVSFRMRYRYSGTTDTGSAYSSVINQSTGAAISGASASMDSNISFNSNGPTVTAPASAIFGITNISTQLNTSANSFIIRSQTFSQNPNNGGGSPFGGFPYTNWTSGGYQGSSSGNAVITGIQLYFSSGNIIGKTSFYGLT